MGHFFANTRPKFQGTHGQFIDVRWRKRGPVPIFRSTKLKTT